MEKDIKPFSLEGRGNPPVRSFFSPKPSMSAGELLFFRVANYIDAGIKKKSNILVVFIRYTLPLWL
ncbi:hypothetical protein U2I54_19830 [Bacillus pseudomycoides]|uniref:Uncharacterized protein n=1 Tax=Bacillus bingmayongensis TaxID=1150157 RepID=A0ABU5K0Q9_9BACI|nr:hypothetical protein [Bacillus pseudomycoides]